MQRISFSVTLVIVMAASLCAQEAPDSLMYAVPDVIVHASGISDHAKRSASFSASITPSELDHLSGMPADRALRRSGLVHVRNRGGRSSISTIGLRGNAATQTTISLNGFPLVDEQNGVVDIGLYPLEMIRSISIVRGSQSPFSGSGGMGGSLQLQTVDPRSPVWGLEGSYGSFGSTSGSVHLPLFAAGIPVTVSAGIVSDQGEFTYDVETPTGRATGTRLRNGADMMYGLAQSQQPLSERTMMHAMLYVVDSERGSPGPVSFPEPSDAILYDKMVRGGLRLVHLTDDIAWEGSISGHSHWQKYHDRSPLFPYEDSYTNQGITVRASGTGTIATQTSLNIGAEAAKHTLTATSVSFPEGSTRGAAFGSLTHTFHSTQTILYPSVRLDSFSDLQPILSWKLAVHQPVLGPELLSVRLGIGSGFRMPTFNERFWIMGGNPDLRHERSLMAEGGLSSRFQLIGRHTATLLVHLSDIKDKIVGWPAVNTDRSRLTGVEFSWSWKPWRTMTIVSNASYAQAESKSPDHPGKQLPYIPRLTASSVIYVEAPFSVASVGVEHVSRRYETVDNLEAQSGAPYTIVSASLGVPFSIAGGSWRALCFVDNMLDTSYEIVSGYPMPGRSIRLTVSLEVR